jgi:hypothetical protein
MLGHTHNINLGDTNTPLVQWMYGQGVYDACSVACGSTKDIANAGPITVVTQAVADGLDVNADISDMYIVASFGVDSATCTVEADIGCSLTLPAASVSVMAAYPVVSKVAPTFQPRVVRLGAYVGSDGPVVGRATRTINLTPYLQLADTTPLLPVPAYAVDVVEIRPACCSDVPVHLYIEYYASSQLSSLMKSATLDDKNHDPVAKGARFYRVSNMVALGSYGAVQFRLQL